MLQNDSITAQYSITSRRITNSVTNSGPTVEDYIIPGGGITARTVVYSNRYREETKDQKNQFSVK